GDADDFSLHPAVLDAVLHSMALGQGDGSGGSQPGDGAAGAEPESGRLPFSWGGVTLHAVGATALRARLAVTGPENVTLHVADAAGRPVADVASLTLRPMAGGEATSAAQAGAADVVSRDALFQLDWTPVPAPAAGTAQDGRVVLGTGEHPDLLALKAALDAGSPVPDVVVAGLDVPAADGDVDLAQATHDAVLRALDLLQAWLADERFETSRLVLVSHGAVAARDGDTVTNLPAAAAWGLV